MHWAARGIGLLIFVASLPLVGLSQNKSAVPTGTGSVVGIVIDSDGKRIADANVYALPAQDMTQRFSALSDAEGKFTIGGIPISDDCGWCHTVYVQAYKDSDGYPDKVFAFYHTVDSEVAKVEIEANKAPPFVTVQMGPKTAYLKLVITNPEGNHIGASVTFTRDGFPQGVYGTGVRIGVNETIPVPPVLFRLRVDADGYETWHYGGANYAGKAGLIALKSGQTLNLAVKFRKKK